jgi:hypothetical protein
MSGKSISVLVALAGFSSVAIALTVTASGFGIFGEDASYPKKADFDDAFAAVESAFIQHPEILNPAITAGDREMLRVTALKRMNLEHVSEYVSE